MGKRRRRRRMPRRRMLPHPELTTTTMMMMTRQTPRRSETVRSDVHGVLEHELSSTVQFPQIRNPDLCRHGLTAQGSRSHTTGTGQFCDKPAETHCIADERMKG